MSFLGKHWKKVIMAFFAIFWSGCDIESEGPALYGCPEDACGNPPYEEIPEDSATTVIALYGTPEYNNKIESAEEESSSSADSSSSSSSK